MRYQALLAWTFALVLAFAFWLPTRHDSGPLLIPPLEYYPHPGYIIVAVGPRESLEVPWAFAEDMSKVVACESEWLPGKTSATGDVGMAQINPIHFPRMRELGLNPESEVDLMRFAVMLWQEQGLIPWESSKECWNGD